MKSQCFSTVDFTGVTWLLVRHLLFFVLLTVHVNRSNSEKNGNDLNSSYQHRY